MIPPEKIHHTENAFRSFERPAGEETNPEEDRERAEKKAAKLGFFYRELRKRTLLLKRRSRTSSSEIRGTKFVEFGKKISRRLMLLKIPIEIFLVMANNFRQTVKPISR